jgi:hypothetical protein
MHDPLAALLNPAVRRGVFPAFVAAQLRDRTCAIAQSDLPVGQFSFVIRVAVPGDMPVRRMCKHDPNSLPSASFTLSHARCSREPAMTQKFAQAYLDALFATPEFMKLVEIAGYFAGAEDYRSDQPDFGLPRAVFVFQETLMWFSQAIRSGMWTYYEATPRARQEAMLSALACEAPPGYAAIYSFGMETWQDNVKRQAVDAWIESHEEDCNQWLWRLANQYRAVFERACCRTSPPSP